MPDRSNGHHNDEQHKAKRKGQVDGGIDFGRCKTGTHGYRTTVRFGQVLGDDFVWIVLGAGDGTIEQGIVCARLAVVDLKVTALEAVVWSGSMAATALGVAGDALAHFLVGVMVGRTFVFALFAAFVARALLAHLLVETEGCATFAPRMTFAANCFASQRGKEALVLR